MKTLTEEIQTAINKGKPLVFSSGLPDKELIDFLEMLIINLNSRRDQADKPKQLRDRAEEIEKQLIIVNASINEGIFPQCQRPIRNLE